MRAVRNATPALVAAVLLAACSASSEEGVVAPPTAPDELEEALAELMTETTAEVLCIQLNEPRTDVPEGYTTVLDAVALPTADNADAALPGLRIEQDAPPNYRSQTYIYARTGVPFRLELNEPAALMSWGGSDRSTVVGSEGCDAENEGWIEHAGGFFLETPKCVEMVVATIGGAREEVQVGVGAPCEGQAPAPEPTDQ